MNGPLEIVHVDRGWAPIPVPFKEKKPHITAWQKQRITRETAGQYFKNAAQNIGVILGPASGGLTDIDLDCPEAIGLASYFLPKTDAIFGRASKRNSHWLYVTRLAESDDKAAIRYGDPTGAGTLLEVRFGGGDKGAQTVFPGSTHEEGEEIRWETDGAPARVEDAHLTKAARRVATASLFVRYMPGSGSRHGAFCAIGGFLARCGLTGPEVKHFADAITAVGGFERDHIGHAADAAEAHRSGKRSYGYRTIAEVFGEQVAAKAAEWLDYKSGSDGAAYANGEAGDDDLDDLVEATKADPTAPLLPEAVKRLVALQKADLAEFARVRSKLKDAGCPLAMLDKAIARAAKQAQANKGNGATGDGSFGFRMTPTGLYFIDDPEDPTSTLFICGPLEIVAKNRDDSSNSWGLLLQWKDSDGQPHEWPMPRSLLAGDGLEVRRVLLDGGLSIGSGVRAHNLLTSYLTNVNVRTLARAVAATGWYGSEFVFPDGPIGVAGDERVILQTTNLIDHAYYVRGTLDEWKHEIARLAVGNPLLILAISVAFAAALIGPCQYESGGVHYVGKSSRGKTSTLIAAGSVWGGGSRGYHRQWRATANGLEGTAALHNNALLCLDDIKQASGREVAEVVYMLANNQGKQRASRDGSIRKVAFWQLLFLSTGEVSLADKIAEDTPNRRQSAGQQVRFIDLPCDAGAHGMFDTLHEFESARDFADHLRDAGKRQYGTACRAFIEAIARDLDGAVSAVRESVNQFVAGNCPADSDGQVQRVATRFGLIAAAGEMAIALDILPWPADSALRAAKECFKAWVDARGGPGAAEENDGIEAVRAFLNAHRLSRFLPAWEIEAAKEAAEARAADSEYPPKYPPEQRLINLAGYRKRVGADVSDSAYDDDEDFYITDTAWKEVTAGFNRVALARALAKRAFLVVPKGGKNLSKKERIPGIAKTLRVYHVSHTIFEGQDDG